MNRGGKGYIGQRGYSGGPNREGGVPGSIKCLVCNKMKSKDQYSNRQLQKFSSFSKGYSRNPDIKVTCTGCTASQTVELKCYICNLTKGLDGFAKNQRKDPDNARCIKCVDKVLETEPDMLPPDSEDDESEGDESDEESWDTPKNPPPRRAPSNPVSTREQWGDSEYTESSASSQNLGSSIASSNHTTTPGQNYANAPSGIHKNNTLNDDDMWESARPAKGKREVAYNGGNTSYRGSAPNRAPVETKKGGWAKVEKVPKGKELEWGKGNAAEYGEGGVDEWAQYGRTIRDQKSGKAPKK